MTGPELRQVRKLNRLTLKEFATRLGFSQNSWAHIHRMETGKIPVSDSTLLRLRLYFNFNFEEWKRT